MPTKKDRLSVVEIEINNDFIIHAPDEDGDFYIKFNGCSDFINIDEAKQVVKYLQYHIKQSK